jgi:hypothetical protein
LLRSGYSPLSVRQNCRYRVRGQPAAVACQRACCDRCGADAKLFSTPSLHVGGPALLVRRQIRCLLRSGYSPLSVRHQAQSSRTLALGARATACVESEMFCVSQVDADGADWRLRPARQIRCLLRSGYSPLSVRHQAQSSRTSRAVRTVHALGARATACVESEMFCVSQVDADGADWRLRPARGLLVRRQIRCLLRSGYSPLSVRHQAQSSRTSRAVRTSAELSLSRPRTTRGGGVPTCVLRSMRC